MNIVSRFFLFSCILAATQTVCGLTILEKTIDLGTSHKDQKKYIIQGFAFSQGPETDDTVYMATFNFPKTKQILFCLCLKSSIVQCDVTNVITVPADIPLTDTINLKINLSPEVELFKQLIIALTRKDKQIGRAHV